MGGLQWWDSQQSVEAVVHAAEVAALSAPGEESTQVFSIHEGTKVRIGAVAGEWMEIILADGKVGWVPSESLEIILASSCWLHCSNRACHHDPVVGSWSAPAERSGDGALDDVHRER